jgi:hypothetical protein
MAAVVFASSGDGDALQATGRRYTGSRMTKDAEGESYGLLAEQWLGRSGLLVQIDKGFTEGTYAVHVQFDELAARNGFAAAHRKAGQYCALLREKLGRAPGYKVGHVEDASREGGPGRRRDLEATFLAFRLKADDGHFHDEDMREQFRVALLRAGQSWEQEEAREQSHRRDRRQEEFRGRLDRLLQGAAYQDLDPAIKERLLDEVPALAFPERGRER